VLSGSTISSTVHNNTLADIADALTASLAKDGQTAPTANLPMGGYRHTNVDDAGARTDYARADQVQDGTLVYLKSVAGTNTITATAPLSLAAYAAGQTFRFIPAGSNTGATTLNVNSIGAKNVYLGGAACAGGEIVINVPVEVIYDGTRFHIISGHGAASATAKGVIELATNAEALAGSDAVRAVTSAGLASDQTQANAGHIVFPGGLMLAWGRAAFAAGTGPVTITYSKSFGAVPYAVSMAHNFGNVVAYLSASNAGNCAVTASSVSTGTLYVIAIGPV